MTSNAETFDLMYDEQNRLTPFGLAHYMDQEGGVVGLLRSKGKGPFIAAGVDRVLVMRLERTLDDVEADLRRIGAVL